MAINNLKKFIMTPPKDTADPKKNEDKTKLEENSSLFQSPQDGSKLFGATTRDQSNKNTDNNMEIEEIKQGAPKEVNSKDITHSTQLFTNESNNQVLSSHTSTTTKRYEFYNKTYTKPNNAKKLKSIKETLHSYGNRLQNFLYRTLHLGFPGTNKSRSQRVSEDAINLCTKSRDFIFLAEDTKSGGRLGENAATKLNDIIAGDVNHEGNAGQHVLDRVKNEHGEDVAIINKNNEGEPIEMKEQYFLHQGVKGMLILEINRTFGNADSNTGTSYKLFMFEKNDNNVYPITDETVPIYDSINHEKDIVNVTLTKLQNVLDTEAPNLTKSETVKSAIKIESAVRKMQAQSLNKIPKRSNPLDFSNERPIATGNHATVYKKAGFVVKDLTAKREIEKVKHGITIMNSLAKTNNLEKYNLVEERIIYDSSNHLQYAAKRMDGEAQKVSTENYAITKTFAKDAANAVLFLNSQHIVYGNYKPINFLYKKLPSGDFKFFLQDYGLLSKLENGKMSDGYRINSLCNESLYKSIINEKNEYREQIELPNQISNEQFVKIRNLSGLIFTTLAFHHKVETSGFTNVYNQYNDKYQFRGFCEAIGIKEKSDADLLFKLCYGKKMLSITQLEQVESILRKTFDLKKI